MKKILHVLLLTAFFLLSFPGCQNRNQSETVVLPDSSNVQSDTIKTGLMSEDCTRVLPSTDLGIKPPQGEVDKVGSDSIKMLKKTNTNIDHYRKAKEKSDRDSNRMLKRINPDNTERDKTGSDSTRGLLAAHR